MRSQTLPKKKAAVICPKPRPHFGENPHRTRLRVRTPQAQVSPKRIGALAPKGDMWGQNSYHLTSGVDWPKKKTICFFTATIILPKSWKSRNSGSEPSQLSPQVKKRKAGVLTTYAQRADAFGSRSRNPSRLPSAELLVLGHRHHAWVRLNPATFDHKSSLCNRNSSH